jgi:hypothetical protein
MKFINKIEFSSQIWGCPDGANMLALADRVGAGGPLVYVARDDVRMMAMRDALALLLPQAEVLMFPAWDCLPFDRLSPQGSLVGQRIETLARLRGLIPTPDNDPDNDPRPHQKQRHRHPPSRAADHGQCLYPACAAADLFR